MKKVTLYGKEILFVNVNGNYYAVGSECTHFGMRPFRGSLENNIVTCQNYKARFDVTTGKVVSPPLEPLDLPDIEDLPKYLVKVYNQDIRVKLSPTV